MSGGVRGCGEDEERTRILTELGDGRLPADLGTIDELLLPHLEAGLESGPSFSGVHVDIVDGHALGGGHAHVGEADGETFSRVHMDVGQIRVLALIRVFGSRSHDRDINGRVSSSEAQERAGEEEDSGKRR